MTYMSQNSCHIKSESGNLYHTRKSANMESFGQEEDRDNGQPLCCCCCCFTDSDAGMILQKVCTKTNILMHYWDVGLSLQVHIWKLKAMIKSLISPLIEPVTTCLTNLNFRSIFPTVFLASQFSHDIFSLFTTTVKKDYS